MTEEEATPPPSSVYLGSYINEIRTDIPISLARGVYTPLNRIGIGHLHQRVRRALSLEAELGG